eukprot:TCONS_00059374-protein
MLVTLSFVLLCIISPCDGSKDLLNLSNDIQQMLSCLQQRNITVFAHYALPRYFDKLFELFKSEFVDNEFCYIVNFYLRDEDRIIRLTKEANKNVIEKYSSSKYHYTAHLRMKKLMNQIYEDTIMFGKDFFATKQTFVFIFDEYFPYVHILLPYIEKLRETGIFEVIIYGDASRYESIANLKIPLHNLFLTGTPDFTELSLKNLIDVIKNTDFNRYNFYRSIHFQKDFLNHTCLNGIGTIHIKIASIDDLYLPMALAILQKENEHRKRMGNFKFMKIIFYSLYEVPDLVNFIDDNLKVFSIHRFPEWQRGMKNIFLSILDNSLYNTNIVAFEDEYVYRIPSVQPPETYQNLKWVLFESADEFYYKLNADICN